MKAYIDGPTEGIAVIFRQFGICLSGLRVYSSSAARLGYAKISLAQHHPFFSKMNDAGFSQAQATTSIRPSSLTRGFASGSFGVARLALGASFWAEKLASVRFARCGLRAASLRGGLLSCLSEATRLIWAN
ncbi:MAG: hypothetical protein K1X79_09710 [Oligoflexia bacterium]|nr:hypothetical protein [Oligoflexia bacterium]